MSCSACNDCVDPKPDSCILYTGEDNSTLGLIQDCSTLFEVEEAIITKLVSLLDGSGIFLETDPGCLTVPTNSSGELALPALLDALLAAHCALKSDVTTLQATVGASASFTTSCLTGLPSSPTRDQILQALLTKACSMSTRLDVIEADYITTAQFTTLLNSYFSSTTSPEYTKMPKYVAMPYHGSLSVFDAAGKGLTSAGYQQVYICNGQAVGSFITPDYRGRSPLGANNNIPGGSLDAAVDPSIAVGYTINTGNKKGAFTHSLTSGENGPHSHSVVDNGHTHNISDIKAIDGRQPASSLEKFYRTASGTTTTETATTGITVASSGSGSAHNNLHPTIGTVFIMHIPS